jgi:hypothetical protein
MATEILGYFLPAPALILAWCLWRMRAPSTRLMATSLLGIAVAVMGYFCISGWLSGHFMQGLLIGSFVSAVVHVMAWGVMTIGINLFRTYPE